MFAIDLIITSQDKEKLMKILSLVILCTVLCIVSSCGRNDTVSVIPDKKTNFQTIIFTEPKYGSTITLISDKECEIKTGGGILLAEYARQENKLRIVERALGTASVVYFDILPEGVRHSTSGELYLLPEPLKKYQDQVEAEQEKQRAAQEAEESRQRAAKLEQDRKEKELTKRLTANRDALIQDVRNFLSKGSVFNGSYLTGMDWQDHKPSQPCRITITGDLTIVDNTKTSNSLDQKFEIPAHLTWIGDEKTLAKSGAVRTWDTARFAKEHDGKFCGEVILDKTEGKSQGWHITVKYSVYQGQRWHTWDEGSAWNGTKFEAKRNCMVIQIIKP